MVKEEWNKQIKQVFIDALEYPLIAIPEFWAKKQLETGINKQYFFRRLNSEYSTQISQIIMLEQKII